VAKDVPCSGGHTSVESGREPCVCDVRGGCCNPVHLRAARHHRRIVRMGGEPTAGICRQWALACPAPCGAGRDGERLNRLALREETLTADDDLESLSPSEQVAGVRCEAWDLRSGLPSALVEIATFAAETSIVGRGARTEA